MALQPVNDDNVYEQFFVRCRDYTRVDSSYAVQCENCGAEYHELYLPDDIDFSLCYDCYRIWRDNPEQFALIAMVSGM